MQQEVKRIKRNKKNQYVLAEDVWVRNPYVKTEPSDINDLCKNDIELILANETRNLKRRSIDTDEFSDSAMDNVIICSDGYRWKERHRILAGIPNKNVKVIGVNGSLKKWELLASLSGLKRVMSFYLVNNPYRECTSYLPQDHKYYPNLIASTKTNPEFLDAYPETPFFYSATKDLRYSGIEKDGCMSLDDYRNPVCAAISYCVRMKVKKLALFCCDESFEDQRPASERMKNGLYQYPAQLKSQKIVDGQLYWLRKNGVEIVDCSSGAEYENASYIEVENLASFFGLS